MPSKIYEFIEEEVRDYIDTNGINMTNEEVEEVISELLDSDSWFDLFSHLMQEIIMSKGKLNVLLS